MLYVRHAAVVIAATLHFAVARRASSETDADASRKSVLELSRAITTPAQTGHSGFINIPPEIGSAIAIYTTFNTILGIVDGLEDLNIIDKVIMTGNIMEDRDNLYRIHDLLAEKLDLASTKYDVGNTYTATEIDTNFKFRLRVMSGRNFESANNETCIHDLKEMVNIMRITLGHMELSTYRLVRELSQTKIGEEQLSLETGTACTGTNIAAEKLQGFFSETSGPYGWCRELHGLDPSESQDACIEKCLQLEDCAGFAWFDGTQQPGMGGSRCCFRTSISENYNEIGGACFRSQHARFVMMNATGVGKWLKKHGFEKWKPEYDMKINGLALSVLSASKIQEFLSSPGNMMPIDTAFSIKCKVDAAMRNEEDTECNTSEGMKALYQRWVAKADPFIFFAVRSANKAYSSLGWLGSAASRALSQITKWMPYDQTKYKDAMEDIKRILNRMLATKFHYSATSTLFAPAFQPQKVAGAVAHLLKVALDQPWDNCWFVHDSLMKTNVWSKVHDVLSHEVAQ